MNSGGGALTNTVKCSKCLRSVHFNTGLGAWEHLEPTQCKVLVIYPIAGEAR